MKKNIAYVGFDFGNKNCKVFSNTIEEPIMFDSLITTREGFMDNSHCLEIDGRKYYIGKSTYGVPNTEYRKCSKPNLIQFMYAALALAGAKKNYIVMGLPITQFKEDASELKNILYNEAAKTAERNIKFDGKPLDIEIIDVEVYPEAVMALPDEYEGIVIDIGGGTTDACDIYTDEEGRHIEKPITVPKGMNTVYQDYANALNFKNPDYEFSASEMERNFKRGYYEFKGVKIKIDVDFIYDNFVEDLLGPLRNSKYKLMNKQVTLIGGGAPCLYKFFVKKLDKNVTMIEDSIYSNAIAYQELCEALFDEE